MRHLSAAGLTYLPFREVAAPDDKGRADEMPRVTVGPFLFSVESCSERSWGHADILSFDRKGGVWTTDSLCDIWHHFQLMISFQEPCQHRQPTQPSYGHPETWPQDLESELADLGLQSCVWGRGGEGGVHGYKVGVLRGGRWFSGLTPFEGLPYLLCVPRSPLSSTLPFLVSSQKSSNFLLKCYLGCGKVRLLLLKSQLIHSYPCGLRQASSSLNFGFLVGEMQIATHLPVSAMSGCEGQ